jgi:glucokinase
LTRLIGIDVGGTKCLGVCVDGDGSLLAEVEVPTPRFDALVATLARIVDDLGGGDRVGVGVPGLIDRDAVIRSSPNLAGADHLEIGVPLSRMLDRPVAVDNDATCALVAESSRGVARSVRDAWLITLGTGIGGALLVDGLVRRGSQGFAGEVGHMRVDPRGIECPCGLRGCWERYASGAALARIGNAASSHAVVQGARAGDRGHLAAINEWTEWIAVGLAALANATDPELIVLGGGLVDEGDLFVSSVESKLESYLYAHSSRRVPSVRCATFGRRAGAMGAALLARD